MTVSRPEARVQRSRVSERTVFVLTIATLVGLFAVNIIGFVDTETGSALGCGHDWPLCNGAVIPHIWGLKTLIEFSHRALVATVTVLLLVTSGLAWSIYKSWIEVKALIGIAVGFVFVQAGLGALGVVYGDPPWFLAFHFGFSLLAFVGILLLVIVLHQISRYERREDGTALSRSNLRERNSSYRAAAGSGPNSGLQPEASPVGILRHTPVPKQFSRWLWFTLVYMYGAMYFGAYVSSTGDGSAFRGWPFPTEANSVATFAVDIIHRTIALGLIGLIVYLCVMATRMRLRHRDLFIGSWISLILVVLLAFTGALLVWSHQVLWAFLLHISFVTFVFGSLSYLALQTLPESKQRITENS